MVAGCRLEMLEAIKRDSYISISSSRRATLSVRASIVNLALPYREGALVTHAPRNRP